MTDTAATPLRKARDHKGLPRERVAAQLDPPISSKTLERWESPAYIGKVPLYRMEQLAVIYGQSVRKLQAAA